MQAHFATTIVRHFKTYSLVAIIIFIERTLDTINEQFLCPTCKLNDFCISMSRSRSCCQACSLVLIAGVARHPVHAFDYNNPTVSPIQGRFSGSGLIFGIRLKGRYTHQFCAKGRFAEILRVNSLQSAVETTLALAADFRPIYHARLTDHLYPPLLRYSMCMVDRVVVASHFVDAMNTGKRNYKLL
jgi:hypothetical protein